ncbi:MAG: prolyl-tRNA synthetase associated domain-containing protein [Parvularculaceae bacterium]
MVDRSVLFARLDALNIDHRTVDHAAVFTVEESASIKTSLPGGHSKNLFLKDKKGGLALAVAHADTQVDLVGLGKALGARGRYSFGKPELMVEVLGVTPGSVTPFALLHETSRRLDHVVFDTALLRYDPVWFHPLENTGSTAISPESLLKFAQACGHTSTLLDLSAPLTAS